MFWGSCENALLPTRTGSCVLMSRRKKANFCFIFHSNYFKSVHLIRLFRTAMCCLCRTSSGSRDRFHNSNRPEKPPNYTRGVQVTQRSQSIYTLLFSDNKFSLNAGDFIGSPIEKLCDQNEKPVLDAIFDSPGRCSTELLFSIRSQSILVAVSKDFNGEELVLECSYIM